MCGVIMLIGGTIAMALVNPELEAERQSRLSLLKTSSAPPDRRAGWCARLRTANKTLRRGDHGVRPHMRRTALTRRMDLDIGGDGLESVLLPQVRLAHNIHYVKLCRNYQYLPSPLRDHALV
jgi:hypothetical protein